MTAETDDARKALRATLVGLIGYQCETQAPNSRPTTEYITDRWMQPVLDRLVEYIESQCRWAEYEGVMRCQRSHEHSNPPEGTAR